MLVQAKPCKGGCGRQVSKMKMCLVCRLGAIEKRKPSGNVGPKVYPARRQFYVDKFNLKCRMIDRDLPASLIDQLDRCAGDTERRILLGVSE